LNVARTSAQLQAARHTLIDKEIQKIKQI